MEKVTIALETYGAQKTRHSKEFSSFEGIFWAFSNSQLDEGLNKLNCTTSDILSIGAGGFVLKSKVVEFKALMERHATERKELRKDTKELFNAIVYELRNHEYCISYDVEPALAVLDLTKEDVEPSMLKKACKEALK